MGGFRCLPGPATLPLPALTCRPRRSSPVSARDSAARSALAAGTRRGCRSDCPPCATPPRSAPAVSIPGRTRTPGPSTLSGARWGRSRPHLLSPPPRGLGGRAGPRPAARRTGTWRAGRAGSARSAGVPGAAFYAGASGRGKPCFTPGRLQGPWTLLPSLAGLQQDASGWAGGKWGKGNPGESQGAPRLRAGAEWRTGLWALCPVVSGRTRALPWILARFVSSPWGIAHLSRERPQPLPSPRRDGNRRPFVLVLPSPTPSPSHVTLSANRGGEY